MPAAIFDTHKLVKKLQEAGFPEKQAETLSEVFQDTQEIQL